MESVGCGSPGAAFYLLLLNKRTGENSYICRKAEVETDGLRFGLSFRLRCVSEPIEMVHIIW